MDNNPLNWLPRLGECRRIPGGTIWCRAWDVDKSREGEFTGRIVFEFRTLIPPDARPEPIEDKAMVPYGVEMMTYDLKKLE